MIKIENVSKTYKSKNGENCCALKNINLTINNTGMVFIIGKSGSGKTTLLNILGGLDKPDEGHLIIDGKSTKDFKEKDYDSYRSTYAGFIFQEFNLIESLNVEENILFSSHLLNKKEDTKKLNETLRLVDLKGLNKRKINELSGGQRQRVAIARILNKDCKYIFADEPTGSLDTKVGKQIFDLLKELSKTRLVVVVSHDMENAKKYADRMIEMKNGEIVSDVTRVSREVRDDFYKNNKGEIILPSSRPLTKKEIKQLNNLLKDNVKNIKTSPKQFRKTYPIVEEENNTFDSKLPKISFRNTLKLAVSNIKVKISRFVTIIFILAIALTLLGLSSFFSEFDGHVATVNTFDSNNIDKLVINQGTYNSKVGQLKNKKTVYTDKKFIEDYQEKIGDNYLESRNILLHRPTENTPNQSLTDMENGYQINSEEDLQKVGFSILKGSFKGNDKDSGYVNLMITDVTWYIHCTVESSLLTQTLSSNTVAEFKEFLNNDIEQLGEESKQLVKSLLAKIDGSNGAIVDLSNTEKTIIFSAFRESEALMDFIINYFSKNSAWDSTNVLYRITGIVDTGMLEKDKQLIDSIISKNDITLLTDEEERFKAKNSLYYSKVYADLTDISGFRNIYIYSRSQSRISVTNNINDTVVYPNSYDVLSYSHFYTHDPETYYFLGENNGKSLMLRNGYSKGSINEQNNYKILAPVEEVPTLRPSLDESIIQKPSIDIPSLDDSIKEDFPLKKQKGTIVEEKKINFDSNISSFLPIKPIFIRKTGLQNNDIILDMDVFSSVFGAEAIDRYFVNQAEEDKNVDLIIYLQLAEEAEPLPFRVVGIGKGGGCELMMGTDGLNSIMLDNNVYDSYLIKLSDDISNNIEILELLDKHNSFYVSELSTVMYQIVSIFGVFELVFVGLTIILIAFVIILISNFMNTAITRKTKEIGLLRALGVTKRNVNRIFLYESLLIGLISSGASILLCALAVNPINEMVLMSLPEFFGTTLTIEISLLSFNFYMIPVITIISMVSCIISTIIPTQRTGKIKPSESMRAINK